MRMGACCVITAMLVMIAGCRSNTAPSAASGSAPPVFSAVGPIPGAGVGQLTHYQTNPFAGNPVALQEGRKLFNWYNCSGCHGGHAGGGMGPSLRDNVWIYGNRDDQIFDSIAEGRANGMPSWATKIPEEQIWKLVAYIKSMRTAEEPDPPIVPPHEQVAPPSIIHPNPAAQKDQG